MRYVGSPSGRALSFVFAFALVGCSVPGPADREAALEVVYDQEGTPAFAGQAVAIKSCGNGGFCHADEVDAVGDRFGAPVGLSFDLRVASITNDPNEELAERLVANRDHMLRIPWQIWDQVSDGRMPPRGATGEEYFAATESSLFDRFDDAGRPNPLPPIAVDAGLDIFRNWLAAGAPVVERTQARVDREDNVGGFTVAGCERTCVDATWPDLHARLLVPTCALSRCHDSSEPAADLDFCRGVGGSGEEGCVTADAAAVYARIVGGEAMGDQCTAEDFPIIDAGASVTSLLFLKVTALTSDEICGSRMPLSGSPLSEYRVCALRTWIDCGACEDPSDVACADCVERGREDCNLIPGGATVEACPNPEHEVCVDATGISRCREVGAECARTLPPAPIDSCIVVTECSNRI